MKQFYLTLLLCLAVMYNSNAQCTPVDCSGSVTLDVFGGICGTTIPTGTVNTAYSEQESFVIFNERCNIEIGNNGCGLQLNHNLKFLCT